MVTIEYLKEFLFYCHETGSLKWHKRDIKLFKNIHDCNAWNARFSEKPAGSLNKDGYLEVKINGKKLRVHRLIWLYVYGYLPENEIDHINGIRNDNRLCNLREANKSENGQNIKKAKKNNKQGILGVHFVKRVNKYVAQITINRKYNFLGYFKTSEEAREAYLKAKRELHPFGTL